VDGIWRRPLATTEETRLIPDFTYLLTGYWTVVDNGIYYTLRKSLPDGTLVHHLKFYDFARGQATDLGMLTGTIEEWVGGLTVSSDRRTVVYSQRTYQSSEIMLVEHSFLSTNPEAFCRIPSFAAWREDQDLTPGYDYLLGAQMVFNAGLFDDGAKLGRLAQFYARRILASGIEFDMLFGPAYKGITLAAAVALQFGLRGRALPFSYNRKEAKDHGEGGIVVGAPLRGRTVIVDDVITDGASKRESVELIRREGATPVAVLIALDRMERGGTDDNLSAQSAVMDLERDLGLPVIAIATLSDLMEFLHSDAHSPLAAHAEAVARYRERYGA
jgi:orotate phosphoribosyltransferase